MFKDELVITLKKGDNILKQWKVKANTWNSTGKAAIRDALVDGGFDNISAMDAYDGTSYYECDSISSSKPATDQAKWTATWEATGEIAGIQSFHIKQTAGGADRVADVNVTSFTKPDGVSLEVQWTTTIS